MNDDVVAASGKALGADLLWMLWWFWLQPKLTTADLRYHIIPYRIIPPLLFSLDIAHMPSPA